MAATRRWRPPRRLLRLVVLLPLLLLLGRGAAGDQATTPGARRRYYTGMRGWDGRETRFDPLVDNRAASLRKRRGVWGGAQGVPMTGRR